MLKSLSDLGSPRKKDKSLLFTTSTARNSHPVIDERLLLPNQDSESKTVQGGIELSLVR